MSGYDRRGPDAGPEPSAVNITESSHGKRTLVEQVPGPAVQRRATSAATTTAPAVHEAAAQGVATPSSPLPHGSMIQQLFGRHDISTVQAHTGPEAAASAGAMGAQAYATGNHVVLGAGTDLHTVAHEAAHVVQQRAGVQLSGGVGAEGDVFERHADAVADKVVAGESAEALLASTPAGGATPGVAANPVQRSAKATHMGTFTDEKYALEGSAKLHMTLKFTPGDHVDATKIGLTQTVRTVKGGTTASIDPASRERETGNGKKIDRLSDADTPIYGSPSLGDNKGLKDTPESNNTSGNPTELNPDNGLNATFELGHRTKVGDDWDVKNAGLYDAPVVVGGNNSSREFETTAVALDGPQKDTYYGSVKWGWKKDGSGTLTKVDFDVAAMGVPSKDFLAAAGKWNAAKVRGTVVPKADDTSVLDGSGTEKYKIDAATEMKQKSTVTIADVSHLFVEITSEGDHKGDTVYVKVTDVKDKGDGKALKKLPIVEVFCTTGSTKIYKAADKTEELKTVGASTRVKVLATSGDMKQIEIVDGADTGVKGFVAADGLAKE